MNIDYFIPDEENQTRGFSDDAMARLRKYDAINFILFIGQEKLIRYTLIILIHKINSL